MAKLSSTIVYGNINVQGKLIGAINENNANDPIQIWVGTQAQYNALTKDPNTLYFIIE